MPHHVNRDMMGRIHSVETGGTVDGPGIRYVLFLHGCPLRCQYCHNPDTRLKDGGTFKSVGKLLDEISSYRSFVTRAKGGVTFSGGEPMAQSAFLKELLKGCKNMGLHTCVDTSGYLNDSADDELLGLTDLVLLDIKSFDPAVYTETTGVEVQPTLDFAKRLEQLGIATWIRFVLVPGLTDTEHNIRGLAAFVAELTNVEKVEVLPFHQMAAYKWAELGWEYQLEDTPAAGRDDVERARALFREHGVQAR